MQVYVCDGPKAGCVMEIPDHQRQYPVFKYDAPLSRSSPHCLVEKINYRIHEFGEQEIIGESLEWAFPAWPFTTWQESDSVWASEFCRQFICEVAEQRLLRVAAIGSPSQSDGLAAKKLVLPDVRRVVHRRRLPKGWVWPR